MERPLRLANSHAPPASRQKLFATTSRWASCRYHAAVTQGTGTTPATMSIGSCSFAVRVP